MAEASPLQVDGLESFTKDGPGVQARWTAEIKLALKEFDTYRERCAKIVRRYRAESEMEGDASTTIDRGRLQIIWSTIQTQIPAVYQFPPDVEVSRRFKTKDPVARVAALMLERYLAVDMDRDRLGDETQLVLLDRLLCDMGAMWVEYEPVIGMTRQPVPVQQGADGSLIGPGGAPYAGPPPQPTQDGVLMGEQEFEAVVDCKAPATHVDLCDFLHSPARKWREVRWVARRKFWTRDEIVERFAAGMTQFGWSAKDVPLTQKAQQTQADEEKTGDLFKRAEVWEVWDDRTVIFTCTAMAVPLEVRQRPVRLEKCRWPCPRPYYGTMTNGSMIPVPSFLQWQELADEVDDLTSRIESLTRSIKMVGARPAEMDELDRLFNDTIDNELIAVENWAAFKGEKGGLENAISWLPMERAMEVLVQLQQQRRERIEYIYQINGVGDILRGQGDPNATATQERIKATYGSLRLKQMQQDLAAFLGRVLEIKAEVICEKAPPEVLAEVSAIVEVEQRPEVVQAAVQMLKDQRVRDLRIDVDEESMVALKDEEDKAAAGEFIAAMRPLIDSTMAAMQQAPALLDVNGEALLFAARRFRAGRDFEGSIESFVEAVRKQAEAAREMAKSQPPQPPLPLMVEREKAKNSADLEQMQHQNRMQQIDRQAEVERDKERSQAVSEAAIEQFRADSKERIAQMEASVEARLKRVELEFDMRLEKYKADLKAQNDRDLAAMRENQVAKAMRAKKTMREKPDGSFEVEVENDGTVQ